MTLDSIGSLKKKTIKHRRLAPWYNPQTRIYMVFKNLSIMLEQLVIQH